MCRECVIISFVKLTVAVTRYILPSTGDAIFSSEQEGEGEGGEGDQRSLSICIYKTLATIMIMDTNTNIYSSSSRV